MFASIAFIYLNRGFYKFGRGFLDGLVGVFPTFFLRDILRKLLGV